MRKSLFSVSEQIIERRLGRMEETRLKLLLYETNQDICMEFLARMIEKYGCEIDIENIEGVMKKAG